MTALLVVVLILVAVLLAWREIQHAVYRATYKYREDDVAKASKASLAKSRSVISGKVQETLAPLLPEMLERFNPKDARFLGTPVDFVIFDGLCEDDVRQVCFVEVKTGRSNLNKRERSVRQAINDRRVDFVTVRLPGVPADMDELSDATLKALAR